MKEVLLINTVAAAFIALSVLPAQKGIIVPRVYRANKDLLAEPACGPAAGTTDLCSAGAPFLSLLCTRQETK